jgi:sulfatase modifying factor 1
MRNRLRHLLYAAGGIGLSILPVAMAAGKESMVAAGPAEFESVVPLAENIKTVRIPRFELDVRPVTNGEFLSFVQQHAEWRRDRVSALFADKGYLGHWASPVKLAEAKQADQPVVGVSWFAATAYCEARGARLPRWYEWELAAAADERQPDARKNSEWRQQILNWYADSSNSLPAAGQGIANYYGIKDLHGVVWEWVEDYNSMLVGVDNREQGGADKLEFCGAGALSMEQKENYAILMRVAMLSALEASYTTKNLGFRCAADAGTKP